MDKSKVRIAIASSDGIVINMHFGHANRFYIYELKGEEIELFEIRDVKPVCSGGNHDIVDIEQNVSTISDCTYLLVSKIGDGALKVVESFGMEVYEIPGVIQESVQQLLNHIKIQELFNQERI